MHRYTKLLALAVIVALVPFGIFVTATAGPESASIINAHLYGQR